MKISPSTDRQGKVTLLVKEREVYGNEVTYPVCETSIKFAKIAGTKTLTPQVIELIKEIGFAVAKI